MASTPPAIIAAARSGVASAFAATADETASPQAAPPRTAKRQATGVTTEASGLEAGPQGVHRRRADPVDLVELVHRRDAAVLVPELEDLLCGHRADPLDRVEVLDARGPHVDRGLGISGGRAARDRGPGGYPDRAFGPGGNDDLLAVREPGGEVERVDLRACCRAPRALDRVVYASAGRQAVDARVGDCARHVHDDVGPARGIDGKRPARAGSVGGVGVRHAAGNEQLRAAERPHGRDAAADEVTYGALNVRARSQEHADSEAHNQPRPTVVGFIGLFAINPTTSAFWGRVT